MSVKGMFSAVRNSITAQYRTLTDILALQFIMFMRTIQFSGRTTLKYGPVCRKV
jgi:hypothetical protein